MVEEIVEKVKSIKTGKAKTLFGAPISESLNKRHGPSISNMATNNSDKKISAIYGEYYKKPISFLTDGKFADPVDDSSFKAENFHGEELITCLVVNTLFPDFELQVRKHYGINGSSSQNSAQLRTNNNGWSHSTSYTGHFVKIMDKKNKEGICFYVSTMKNCCGALEMNCLTHFRRKFPSQDINKNLVKVFDFLVENWFLRYHASLCFFTSTSSNTHLQEDVLSKSKFCHKNVIGTNPKYSGSSKKILQYLFHK